MEKFSGALLPLNFFDYTLVKAFNMTYGYASIYCRVTDVWFILEYNKYLQLSTLSTMICG
jgi:hypothetical protein